MAPVIMAVVLGLLASLGLPEWAWGSTPPYVTYGRRAAASEGDPDHQQMLYVALPSKFRDPVYVRIFDGDSGGRFDTAFGSFGDTRTRFAVYGGEAAYRGPPKISPRESANKG